MGQEKDEELAKKAEKESLQTQVKQNENAFSPKLKMREYLGDGGPPVLNTQEMEWLGARGESKRGTVAIGNEIRIDVLVCYIPM